MVYRTAQCQDHLLDLGDSPGQYLLVILQTNATQDALIHGSSSAREKCTLPLELQCPCIAAEIT